MPNILLGVCGGISAYKSCEIVREFQRRGSSVRVIMTEAAKKFVTPLTFESLTRFPVHCDLFGDGAFGTAHIETARWADFLVVAPATANTISRFARGEANDFLSTVYLAFRGPVYLAPAMNTAMWDHPAFRANVDAINRHGTVRWIDPVEGDLACGEQGVGKMAEPVDIVNAVLESKVVTSPLAGLRAIVTGGPTREYLDPVRYLSSPSSGKMGLAVAREGAKRGVKVTLVHGPLSIDATFEGESIAVTSAQEMAEAVDRKMPADIFIGAAAVADYAWDSASNTKLKRGAENLDVRLKKTPDVLALAIRHRRPGDCFVGFAAETDHLKDYAKEKLEMKGVDIVVANEVDRDRKGFALDRTDALFLDRKTVSELKDVTKSDVARALWDAIERQRRGNDASR